MNRIRTRFAPSPTGLLHIGGFRSAFYAWLLARRFGGSFVLRIEDTDQERRVPGAVKYILDGFEWFGLDIDEGPTADEIAAIDGERPGYAPAGGPFGPYIQSMRLARYREIADQLVAEGAAYRCDCTPEMIEHERLEQRARGEVPGYSGYCRTRNVSKEVPHVVRFKMPDQPKVILEDGIRGRIEWEKIPLRDPILMKSDGFPTYHLAVVVDDHDMQISHALRGEEWLPSAPLHLLVHQALGWAPPIYCHLPVVLGDDGKKLSKRHGATSWSTFRDQGYLPEAVLNFVVRIGWSPGEGEEQEIFSLEELVSRFSLDRVNAASGVFEYAKLEWMNGVYIRNLSDQRFFELARPFLLDAGLTLRFEDVAPLIPHVKERTKLLTEAAEPLTFLDDGLFQLQPEAIVTKKLSASDAVKVLRAVQTALEALPDFLAAGIEQALEQIAADLSLKPGMVFLPTRLAVLGKGSLPLVDSLQVLGKLRVLARLAAAVQALEALSGNRG